uniref:Fibronectin type III domain-containing protein n=1 Tax=Candidatus Kentrum eta TaxID=2126337 RepID=A0A450UVG2_9GAMM|nr:MAG: Fibronectin type III domain-containing protein [Candidatus Kentron sp. H]VFJ97090.1 MAG: Fibronectin type III domain-containing protein [Candidatus Kentron sp. H]VFK02711.1 MAG: Fibronectin type III domain-containing protein [Candidatus Kentron sp. H]
MQFPDEESKILALARRVSAGLSAHTGTYPAPPVGSEAIDVAVADYVRTKDAVVLAQGALKQAVDDKEAALGALVDRVKQDLRYAENTVHFNDSKLSLLGWGGRRAATPLEAPGQALNLTATEQGNDWITLTWKKPTDGGKVATYKIQRREGSDDAWATVETTLETTITLGSQEAGKKFEYCVAAMNKAGIGQESNTVMAVL